MIWDLVQRCHGQVRAVLVQDRDRQRLHVLGFDMGAVMAVAVGMGVPGDLVAEFLPEIEAVMRAKANQGAGDG